MMFSATARRFGLCLLLVTRVVLAGVPPATRLSYARHGDIMLGGLFPMHSVTDCDGSVPTMWSVQLAESMVFAIDKINRDDELLPNVTLGFDIRDSCWDEDVSLWSALSLVQGKDPISDLPSGVTVNSSGDGPAGKVVGIVGPMTSFVSLTVTSVADLYDVPMITYAATSDELSDKTRFPYFLRTVPPDRWQAEALVDLISYMGWGYISIVYWADTYGIRGAHALADLAERRGVCVALSLPVQKLPTKYDLDRVTSQLMEAPKARVVIVFADFETASAVIATLRDKGVDGHFTWIGTEAWAHTLTLDALTTDAPLPVGTVFIFQNNPEPREFHEYFINLTRDAIKKNPWFEAFLENWEAEHNCTVFVDETCGVPHKQAYSTSSLMSPVMDAVYAFAHALHSLINDSTKININGKDLLRHLMDVSFIGERGKFQFSSDGAVAGKYLLKNVQIERGKFKLATVGQWDALAPAERLTFKSAIVWGNGSTLVPASVCKETCPPGSRVVPLEKKCCFGCSACEDYAIVFNNTECIDCKDTEWPDEKRLSCVPIIPAVSKWTNPLQLTIVILSCMGFGLSILIAVGLVWYRNHVVIKATSRELSCFNIFGLLLAFFAPFLLIAHPRPIVCCAAQAMVSLCFTLAYAPILLKVCRIYRIFRAGKRSAGRLKLISPIVQLIIVCMLILIQVICVIVTSSVQPCHIKYLVHRPRDGTVELYCAFDSGFLVSCLYNLVLILGSCMFALLARKVPDNYNESKFIGVSVYSTLLACMAAIPIYFTSIDVSQKVAALSLTVLLNAYLTAICLYIPKLYVIRFLTPSGTTPDRLADNIQVVSASTSQCTNRNRVHPAPINHNL